MLTWLLLAGVAAGPPAPTTVLVLPIQSLSGASVDLAEVTTQLLVAEAGRLPGSRVSAFREVEGTMSQEQLRGGDCRRAQQG